MKTDKILYDGGEKGYILCSFTRMLHITHKIKLWVHIRNVIEEFKPIKPIDFQDKTINNDKYN